MSLCNISLSIPGRKGQSCTWLFFVCVWLCSCTTLSPSIKIIESPDVKIHGKIGIRQEDAQSGSSLFEWLQQGERYYIRVFNLLGQTRFVIAGNQQGAILQTSDGKTIKANTPEKLLKKTTGWHFPIRSVSQWMNGRTAVGDTDIIRNESGQLTSLNTGKWQIEFDRFKIVNDIAVPHKIDLSRLDLQVKLIVKDYETFRH